MAVVVTWALGPIRKSPWPWRARRRWRSAKHAAQWTSTLATCHVFPSIGDPAVGSIETSHVLDVLKPIWSTKPETASRVRQRIEAVLDYAAAKELRDGINPARWRGHLQNLLPKPSSVRAVQHHPALDWRELSQFMHELAGHNGVSARALEFLILTAARSGEVRGMKWSEVDIDGRVWTVPADRTKARREHRVPLSRRTLMILGEPRSPDALVFPSPHDTRRSLSDMTLTAVLRSMERNDITVHGFRSTFREWAGETSSFPRQVIEAALAHRLKDKAEAAYARGDLFAKRRELMRAWADFSPSPTPDDAQ